MKALITGASSGIGRDIATELAQRGYDLILVARNIEKLNQVKENILNNCNNINIKIIQMDVSTPENCKNLYNQVNDDIDILINNAGISETKLFTDVTDEDWNKIISNNLYSTFCVTQEVVKNMIHNKNGCIINISSIWGSIGASCESIYAISKAGIDSMTKSLAKELGPSNIRVNSVAPGFINTDMNKQYSESEIDDIKEEIPLHKIGMTQDIAKCVNWLVEDEYTTGQIIPINGGWSIV